MTTNKNNGNEETHKNKQIATKQAPNSAQRRNKTNKLIATNRHKHK